MLHGHCHRCHLERMQVAFVENVRGMCRKALLFLFSLPFVGHSAWLSPNKMDGEDSKKSRNNPDGQNYPFHGESLLVNLSSYS